MLPGMELMGCRVEVPASVMHHVVKVESSYNPYAIGVVGGRLARQPRTLAEAVATAEMLEARGINFSLGLAQVNRYNLPKFGVPGFSAAFTPCINLLAGSRILRECHARAGGDWGKAFSCYYSGNFTTGYRHGYVQKVQRSMLAQQGSKRPALAIPVIVNRPSRPVPAMRTDTTSVDEARPGAEPVQGLVERRGQPASGQSPSPTSDAASLITRQTPAAGEAPVAIRLGGMETPKPGSPVPPAESRDDAFVF